MKIAYVGNFSLNFTTETHISKTLEKMGHEVVRIQETPQANPTWLNSLMPRDADLFLFTRTWGKMVTLNDLARLKEWGIPTASYHLDLYVGLSRQSGIDNDPFWRTEYVFSADGDPESQRYFENKGINHFWLLPAVYEDECIMLPPNNDYTLGGDVIFVGGGAEYGHPEWPYRHDLVRHLSERYGDRYKKYGHPQRGVRGMELNQLYANAKIAVGDSVNIGFKHKNYTSDRLFESIGRGGFTIYPRIEGIADLFEEGKNAVFYEFGNFKELDKKIDYYLKHDKEREAIRKAGYAFVKSSQTYTQRLQELLDKITEEGAFNKPKSRTAPFTRPSVEVLGEKARPRIGLIARSDRTGLGNQTRNLARMLRPDEIMLIDSTVFNGNKQHPELYAQYSVTNIDGFPKDDEIREWLRGVDVVITCEIFYNNRFVDIASSMGVKTINQYNWEFADYLRQSYLTLPDKLISPSKWKLQESRRLWGNVEYLPTPIFVDDFNEVRQINYNRSGRKRFLHVMGKQAANDRNGTLDLINAMRYSREDFELVIKSQNVDLGIAIKDPRITFDTSNPENEVDLYRDFDALIIPRRYGGQCLPMMEGLCAGLPVIMTDVSPNNDYLPQFWLVNARTAGMFMARTWIEMFTVHHASLGDRLDFFSKKDLRSTKQQAYNIGYREFSNYELEQKWEKLIEDTFSR